MIFLIKKSRKKSIPEMKTENSKGKKNLKPFLGNNFLFILLILIFTSAETEKDEREKNNNNNNAV